MKKVLVCGGRDYSNAPAVLDAVGESGATLVIHGAARGADTLAGIAAHALGIPERPFPADWKCHGRKAGYIRNRQMLDEGKPDLVIAFPGGKGTAMMKKLARSRGVEVQEIDE